MHWPGNVRELNNVMQRAAILASGSLLQPEDLAVSNPKKRMLSALGTADSREQHCHEQTPRAG